ncbi:hypothetical protein DIS18_13585 [Algibacter marinivivus]|uniref:CarboxypepD_reg-like domain-containing protein n=1 Tax=Algibacter marinivivus TaxID=2100723 RepID=A0A2U2X1Q1_9FLAO|nr:hypothetical protein DIS18_13585 [Algibacter marinivivus]
MDIRSLCSNLINLSRVFISILFLLSISIHSQTINRVEVKGILLSNNNDVEAVTVFNKSSNKGTITNIEGEFKLKVAQNDVVEISALQFQTVNITIDVDIIESKQLKIQLIEEVNKLDAVTLSSGLTGNIETDISQVKTVKPMTIDMGNMNVDFEYNDDKAYDNSVVQNHFKSIINPNARQYLPDVLKIVGLLTKSKKKIKVKKDVFVGYKYEKPKDLFSVYSSNDIQEQFNIPEGKFQAFIAFIENKGIALELLEPENKIHLIEFLVKQRNQFLKLEDEKK